MFCHYYNNGLAKQWHIPLNFFLAFSIATTLFQGLLSPPLLYRFFGFIMYCSHNVIVALLYAGDRRHHFDPDSVCPLILESDYRRHVLTHIISLLESREGHIRQVLLENLDGFSSICTGEDMETIVLPQVLLLELLYYMYICVCTCSLVALDYLYTKTGSTTHCKPSL